MKHLSKLVISVLLVGVMSVVFSACGNKSNSTNTDSDATSQQSVAENRNEHFLHTAVSGAEVIEQDGSCKFTYCHKCDACGYVFPTKYKGNSNGIDTTGFFVCRECKNNQRVEIVTTEY